MSLGGKRGRREIKIFEDMMFPSYDNKCPMGNANISPARDIISDTPIPELQPFSHGHSVRVYPVSSFFSYTVITYSHIYLQDSTDW